MAKPICNKCNENYSIKRLEAGYTTCLTCGQLDAIQDIKAREKLVGIGYNKGGMQLLAATPQRARHVMLDAGRKTSAAPVVDSIYIKLEMSPTQAKRTITQVKRRPIKKSDTAIQRKRLGIMYIDNEPFTWYLGQNPKDMGATRWVRMP